MKNNRVTAIGEILWDVYPDKKRLGGAPFNFIYHVWKLMGNANFISSVGNDENGKEILAFLKSKNFPVDLIYVDDKHPTGTVTVKINEDKTPEFKISAECCYDYITINTDAAKIFEEETDLLYFGTLSQRGEISRSTIESMFGRNKKYFCDLNLRHNFFSKEMIEKALNVCSVIKINSDELSKIKNLFGLSGNEKEIVSQLSDKYKIDLTCVTLGAEGALLFDGTEFDEYKAESENIIDTVGAGDAFAAILCVGYLRGMDIKKINNLANNFAADICGVKGALPSDDSIYFQYINAFIDR